MTGKTLLITSGPTREYIDDVRFISNPSSGKTGYFLALEAVKSGAKVIFITGKSAFVPEGCEIINVTSASDMLGAVLKNLKRADVLIGAAAVGDYAPEKTQGKLERKNGLVIELKPTPDIMAQAGETKGRRVHGGFAAESGEKRERAVLKMKKKNLDFIVFNDISKPGSGFESDSNSIEIIMRNGRTAFKGTGTKEELASAVIGAAAGLMK